MKKVFKKRIVAVAGIVADAYNARVQRQADLCGYEANMAYIANSRPVRAT